MVERYEPTDAQWERIADMPAGEAADDLLGGVEAGGVIANKTIADKAGDGAALRRTIATR